jgi:multidrug efflux system membrane fusion protein
VSELHARGDRTVTSDRRARRVIRVVLLLLLVASAGGGYGIAANYRGQAKAAVGAQPAAVPVGVGPVTTQPLPIWLSGIGSVQPLNAITVKVRVDGQLDRVAFTEGQDVHAGDLLAQIDPRPFQAQLKQAEANLAKDQAQLGNTKLDLARFSKLAENGYSPRQQLDTTRAQVASLEATVEADQAMVDNAKLQVSFTSVTAPLDGRVGLRLVDPGSIVHVSDATGLVTVTEMQPIAVLFSLPQDDLPAIRAAMAQGKPTVVVDTRDGGSSLAQGELVFIDSQVDAANGQVRLKASFANADRSLWPGQLVSARLLVRTDANATVVPARAVLRGQNGPYVYAVKPDQTVEIRRVTTGATVGGVIALTSGVAAGETVVLDGQAGLADGTKVDAKAAVADTATPGGAS